MLKYSDIIICDDKNSDDFSVTIFFNHCEHRCEGCHNPSTWVKKGKDFNEKVFESVLDIYRKDTKRILGNLVLTGGDPLSKLNRYDMLNLVKEFKKQFPYVNIWIYTGYDFDQVPHEFLNYVDTFKCGRYIKELSTTTNIQHDIRLATSNQKLLIKNIDY